MSLALVKILPVTFATTGEAAHENDRRLQTESSHAVGVF